MKRAALLLCGAYLATNVAWAQVSMPPQDPAPSAAGVYQVPTTQWNVMPTSAQACCMPNGTCAELDPSCCTAAGGSPQGFGSACLPAESCCLPDNSCIDTDPTCYSLAGGRAIIANLINRSGKLSGRLHD